MYFRNFVIISPWKRINPSFEQTWIPFTQGCYLPSLVQIGPAVLKKMKMWKDYDNDDDRQRTNFDQKAHLSPWLRWAKKCLLFDRTTHQRVLYDANQKPLTNEDTSVAFFNLDKGKTVSLSFFLLIFVKKHKPSGLIWFFAQTNKENTMTRMKIVIYFVNDEKIM